MQPEIVPSIGAYNVQGCYTDAPATRVLGGYQFQDNTGMTMQECVGACQGKGCELSFVVPSQTLILGSPFLSLWNERVIGRFADQFWN